MVLKRADTRCIYTMHPAVSHESVESFQKRHAAVVKYIPYV